MGIEGEVKGFVEGLSDIDLAMAEITEESCRKSLQKGFDDLEYLGINLGVRVIDEYLEMATKEGIYIKIPKYESYN